jgi:hypothetical protein
MLTRQKIELHAVETVDYIFSTGKKDTTELLHILQIKIVNSLFVQPHFI